MNLIFLGPPGSGKGTQAKQLSQTYKLLHLSTGDVFREAIQQKTKLGLTIKSFVDAGKLVPDQLVSETVFEKLSVLKENVILDGYPRTLEQANALLQYGLKNNFKIDFVVFFDVELELLVKRLSSRRQCTSCKDVYNLETRLPKKEGICDQCGNALIQRQDDKEAVIRDRLVVYQNETEPLLNFYKSKKGFVRVDASRSINEVLVDVLHATNLK